MGSYWDHAFQMRLTCLLLFFFGDYKESHILLILQDCETTMHCFWCHFFTCIWLLRTMLQESSYEGTLFLNAFNTKNHALWMLSPSGSKTIEQICHSNWILSLPNIGMNMENKHVFLVIVSQLLEFLIAKSMRQIAIYRLQRDVNFPVPKRNPPLRGCIF